MNAIPNRLMKLQAGPEPQKVLVRSLTHDNQADWLLNQAQNAAGSARLRYMRRAAERLGELRAERHAEPVAQWAALNDVALRNGILLGGAIRELHIKRTLQRDMEKGFRRKALFGASRFVNPALADVRAHIRLNPLAASNDWSELVLTMEAAADALAVATGLEPIAIFREVVGAARLTGRQAKAAWRPISSMIEVSRKGQSDKVRRIDEAAFKVRDELGIVYEPGPLRAMVDPFAKEAQRQRFKVSMFGDLDTMPVKNWLIDDVLGDGEFSCFWGLPGCGKSVIVGDAAFHVAAGRPWHGRTVRKGLVVFVAAERADLTRRRFSALRKVHGGADAPLAVIEGRLDMTAGVEDVKDIVAAVRGLEERTGEPCVWVIIDTIARTFGAGDENKQSDMGAYVQACDLLREELSSHVTVIHHCSRTGEKPRGSIALDGAVDATFKVSKAGSLHSVAIDKENDAPNGGAIRFRMEGVELGRDRNGKVTTAPIAVADDSTVVAFETADGGTVKLGRTKGPTRGQLAFKQALAEVGQLHPSGHCAVSMEDMRTRLASAFGGANVKPESLAAIVRRELKKLIDNGNAQRIGEWVVQAKPGEE